MANDIIVSDQAQQFLPVMSMATAMQRYQMTVEFTRRIMKKDTDYGIVPGTGVKPSLLKPGAEKLCSFFGLSPVFVPIDTVEDWTGDSHGGEAFFLYRYRCELYRNGTMIGSGIGSCNSWESKYRYRNGKAKCPSCDAEAISRSKYPPRNRPNDEPGWWCNPKNGGCGANFEYGDKSITEQTIGKVKNPDAADIVNTVDKMAQKRALVAATLIAVNASEFFTQDIEDMAKASDYVDAEFTVTTATTATSAQSKPVQVTPSNGNGKHTPPPVADNPFDDDLPAEVKLWKSPMDAQAWAVECGASDNEHSARNAFKNAVDAHGGKLTTANMTQVFVTYYRERSARAIEKAKRALEDVTLAGVAEMEN